MATNVRYTNGLINGQLRSATASEGRFLLHFVKMLVTILSEVQRGEDIMIKWLQRIPIGRAIRLGVLVVLVIGLIGCVQLSSAGASDPPVPEGVPSTSTEPAASGQGSTQGEALFARYCQSCHGEKGTGTPRHPVALKDAVRGMDQATLTRIISNGPGGGAMPAFGKTLTEEQITDLVAFIRSW